MGGNGLRGGIEWEGEMPWGKGLKGRGIWLGGAIEWEGEMAWGRD